MTVLEHHLSHTICSWVVLFVIPAFVSMSPRKKDAMFEGVVYNGHGVGQVREDGVMAKDQDEKDRSVSVARSASE